MNSRAVISVSLWVQNHKRSWLQPYQNGFMNGERGNSKKNLIQEKAIVKPKNSLRNKEEPLRRANTTLTKTRKKQVRD